MKNSNLNVKRYKIIFNSLWRIKNNLEKLLINIRGVYQSFLSKELTDNLTSLNKIIFNFSNTYKNNNPREILKVDLDYSLIEELNFNVLDFDNNYLDLLEQLIDDFKFFHSLLERNQGVFEAQNLKSLRSYLAISIERISDLNENIYTTSNYDKFNQTDNYVLKDLTNLKQRRVELKTPEN
ncbi:hypothetical protein [Mycoplasmopsis agassizii]|uniref:Uncharacterized protein n=1 Tax=Mycoplasmopsis agassizii TaxID=33922 RepID=A0ABX4H5T2_9BACT|nr:hypothetical protein [Mycoplasmopsis agassizii]PAF55167.1 hypothetical protein CJF60_00575 [Mycoplasmopsis agassizii]SMC16837.1 hypothetical protein SAMN02745179_00338 [Mycoplasmopsis agassizii]